MDDTIKRLLKFLDEVEEEERQELEDYGGGSARDTPETEGCRGAIQTVERIRNWIRVNCD